MFVIISPIYLLKKQSKQLFSLSREISQWTNPRAKPCIYSFFFFFVTEVNTYFSNHVFIRNKAIQIQSHVECRKLSVMHRTDYPYYHNTALAMISHRPTRVTRGNPRSSDESKQQILVRHWFSTIQITYTLHACLESTLIFAARQYPPFSRHIISLRKW